jgi:hypothetical protein
MDSSITPDQTADYADDHPPRGRWNERLDCDLTSSELRLLPLLTSWLSLGEIAQRLEIPRDEVLAQTQSIYAKFGLLGKR